MHLCMKRTCFIFSQKLCKTSVYEKWKCLVLAGAKHFWLTFVGFPFHFVCSSCSSLICAHLCSLHFSFVCFIFPLPRLASNPIFCWTSNQGKQIGSSIWQFVYSLACMHAYCILHFDIYICNKFIYTIYMAMTMTLYWLKLVYCFNFLKCPNLSIAMIK